MKLWQRIRNAWHMLTIPWSDKLQAWTRYEKAPEGTLVRNALLEYQNAQLAETNSVLEHELFQLRGELRGATNTMLSQAGVTPLPPVNEEPPKPINRIRHLTMHQQRRADQVKGERTAIVEAKELRKRFEDKNHPAVRSN